MQTTMSRPEDFRVEMLTQHLTVCLDEQLRLCCFWNASEINFIFPFEQAVHFSLQSANNQLAAHTR
jgi:hypothetical protein